MIVIIDPSTRRVTVTLYDKEHIQCEQTRELFSGDQFNEQFYSSHIYKNMKTYEPSLSIGIRMAFGGDIFTEPTIVTKKMICQCRDLIDYSPRYMLFMINVLTKLEKTFKQARIITFFETAFFLSLPEEERLYAINDDLLAPEQLQRHGYNGIYHEFVAKSMQEEKIISVVMNKKTTICGSRGEYPVAISLGATPLEGVMSRTSCGDVDPGLVLQYMHDTDVSLFAMDDILKHRSGFRGVTGYDLTMREYVSLWGRDKKVDFAFELYQTHILKYIGETIAELGGVDSIVFVGENVCVFKPIIIALIKKLGFLGVSLRQMPIDMNEGFTKITAVNSCVSVCWSSKVLADILNENMQKQIEVERSTNTHL